MAPRYRDPDDFDTPETDGGEARPRPLKSRRLVDVMEPASKGKERGRIATEAPDRRERIAPASSVSGAAAPRQKGSDTAPPIQALPERTEPKQAPSEQVAFKKKTSPKTAPPAPAKPSAPDLPPDTCAVLSVTPAGEGETVTVVKLHGEGAIKRRIMDMGITKGVSIRIRKVAPLGDPMELTVRGYELSLRRADAEMIEIQ